MLQNEPGSVEITPKGVTPGVDLSGGGATPGAVFCFSSAGAGSPADAVGPDGSASERSARSNSPAAPGFAPPFGRPPFAGRRRDLAGAVVCGLLGLVAVAAIAEIVRECLEEADRESEREGGER